MTIPSTLTRLCLALSTSFSIALFLAISASQAVADEYSDIAKLMKGNQMSEAMSKADQYLASKPRDPQMRFLKGVIQSETGKTNDAINTFVRLTEEYPELPEPYNNLAVLYANGGQFDKARTSLEMAIRTNPSYATAHENLGDIYARMASQAYTKALQLDNSNTAVSPKLALIRELFTPTTGRAAVTKPTASTAIAAAAPVVVAPAVPAVTTSPTGSTQPSMGSIIANNALITRDVTASAEAWAKAWSDRDMKSYLASYGKDFTPPNKLSRAAWEEERKARIMGKAKISVKLSNFVVTVSGNTAIAKFKQDYKADALATSSRKTLELMKAGDRWVITKEIAG